MINGLILMSLRTTSGVNAVDRAMGLIAWHVGADLDAQQNTPVETESGAVLVVDNCNLCDIAVFAAYPAPVSSFIGGSHNSCFRAHRYRAEDIAWL
tara:strand:+ start:103 stop:390 length:288 start_codon:yes stop_codon:yes gene_type:complete